jgi:hypothetical protein
MCLLRFAIDAGANPGAGYHAAGWVFVAAGAGSARHFRRSNSGKAIGMQGIVTSITEQCSSGGNTMLKSIIL